MDMVEKVARAICVADGLAPDALPNEDFADGSEVMWMTCRDVARAAIAAMREPTEAMVRSVVREVYPNDQGLSEFEAADIWGNMIDAALTPSQS